MPLCPTLARSLTRCFPVVLAGLFGSACGSKGAVSLTAHLESPALSVQQAALGTGLSGSFDLVLELGDYADQGTDVSLGSFGIVQGSEELVSALTLSADGASFPLRIEPGKSKRATLSVGGSQTYDASVGTSLCSGQVFYRGAVTDSESDGKPTPVQSNPFTPSCP
ncbi:MAG TPA: hypothetical protein VGP93_00205 [Polyangiaceae bacterium]|nr:hypothetical protein [Polyangiaceae bacterium]